MSHRATICPAIIDCEETGQLSEKRWQSDMDSWHRHLLRCMENPEMWEEGSEDLETYRFWNGLGRRET